MIIPSSGSVQNAPWNRPAPEQEPDSDPTPTNDDTFKPSDALQAAKDRAQKRFGQIPGVSISVVAPEANSGRPVVVLHQGDVQPGYRVQTHFHGDQLYDQDVDYDGNIGKTIQASWDKNGQTVFVLPEAKNESAAPRSDWTEIKNVGLLTREALEESGLNPDQAGTEVLSGHSAGGTVVAWAIADNKPAPHFGLSDLNRIELYDCSVGSLHNPVSDSQRAKTEKWTRAHEDTFVYVPGTMTSSAWLNYIDKSRYTQKETDHFDALWHSLGAFREPGH